MAKRTWMILHIPSGEYVTIYKRFLFFYDSKNIWSSRNKAYWAIIDAINEHNDAVIANEEKSEAEKADFAQSNVGRGAKLFFSEFEIRRVFLEERTSTAPQEE